MGLRTVLGLKSKRPASNLVNEHTSPQTQAFSAIETLRSNENPNYPANVRTAANAITVDAIRRYAPKRIAEFGILNGDTTEEIAKIIGSDGEIHIFDFEHNVANVINRLQAVGFKNIIGYGTSTKLLDSYNWSLSKLIEKHTEPIFDYAFIDGAHTWNVDALTFFLVDRLLVVGGFIDFDDYNWSLKISPTLAPDRFPKTLEMYTDEQIEDPQVKRLVDLLVKRDDRYEEIVANKIYRKIK